jgi:hypothetical protein
MKSIRLKVSDETYRRIGEEAKAQGFPGIASYALSKIGIDKFGDDSKAEARSILNEALLRVRKLEPLTVFTLRNLFSFNEWKSYTKAARKQAEDLFRDEVLGEEGLLKDCVRIRGASSNHLYTTITGVTVSYGKDD